MLIENLSDGEVLDTLLALGRERLTRKQKCILEMLRESECQMTTTRFVLLCSSSLGCSQTAVRNAVKSLRKAGVLEENRKGEPLEMTPAGILISKHLEVRE